jgi:hypothetical protein
MNSGQCADCGGRAYVAADGFIGEYCNDCLAQRYITPARKKAYFFTGPRAELAAALDTVHGAGWQDKVTAKAIRRADKQSRYTGRKVNPEC